MSGPLLRSPGDRPAGGSSLARSVELLRAFRAEQSDPGQFYTLLAKHAVDQVAAHCDLAGRTVVDVGGGAGYFTEAFNARGARCCLVEPDAGEMWSRGAAPAGAVRGDGYWLPFPDASVDVSFSSNVLEHVSDPTGLLDEMIRITKPGGLVYVAYTNWFSPWGGHETAPWHYLGAGYAGRRYARRTGREPKHRLGRNLFAIHIGPMLRHVRARGDVEVAEARPRYYPPGFRVLLAVPLLREVATWNLLLILRRREAKA
jgi:SAM-dependent methyltransferase